MPSRAEEARELAIIDRIMAGMERGFALRVYKVLQSASKKAAREVEAQGAGVDIPSILQSFDEALLPLFEAQYRSTAEVFGKRILNAFKSFSGYEKKAVENFDELVFRFISKNAADNVQKVKKTTILKIRASIESSMAATLPAYKIAANIVADTGGKIARLRAVTIARTEVHTAAGFGAQAAAESTGVTMKRVWIAGDDDRTRETHAQADSESHADPVGMNDPFPVLGLMYPGDPSGPPEDVINCRCAVGYIPV